MAARGWPRQALLYTLIAVGGFALAYLIVAMTFFPGGLPSRSVPPIVPETIVERDPLPPPLPEPDTDVTPDTMWLDDSLAPSTARSFIPVPDLTWLSVTDARAMLARIGLGIVVRRDTSSIRPPNTVLQQIPAAGDSLPVGSGVTVTISEFPPSHQP